MTIAECLRRVRDELAEWMLETGGTAEVATDAVHLVTLLSSKPGAARAAVLFDGEELRGDLDTLGRVDRRFLVVVSRGRGLLLDSGDRLTAVVGAGGKPLFDLVEEAREVVRLIRFDEGTTEVVPRVSGIRRVEMEGMLVDAYQIEFSLGVQLAVIEE